jgi:HPt (histidine-containing phosphotransfer) domain-containing protein
LSRGDNVAINQETINALREYQTEGEPDFVTELIDAFLADSPQRLNSMKAALLNQNPLEFGKSAHGLKGSSGNLGADKLASLCFQGEVFGKNGNLSGASEQYSLIEAEFQIVIEELKSMRKP